jgi:recombination protein RecA
LTAGCRKANIRRKCFSMPPALVIRRQIETALANRIPSALTPPQRSIRPVVPTGVAVVDELLDGGLPLGAITEMTGAESSGRTSLALSYIARVTQEGGVCAWVDVCDALHVESAAAAGTDLSRLLWVRCGVVAEPKRETPYQFALPDKYFIPPPVKQGLHGGGFGPHPRTEAQGLSDAVSDLLKPESIRARNAEPQPERQSEKRTFESSMRSLTQESSRRALQGKPWARVEQALSATDLLLQGGGFRAIVLDMAGVAPQYVSRIELSIWFRYRAAVERTQASLLLLTQHPCAKSAGELLLRFHSGNARCDEKTVFTGIEHRLEVERRRFAKSSSNVVPLKKPAQRERFAHWSSRSTWAGVR